LAFSLISRALTPESRAALLAVCTAARDGVLLGAYGVRVELSSVNTQPLRPRAALLSRARSQGLLKQHHDLTAVLKVSCFL
jgi:hypothetical protein